MHKSLNRGYLTIKDFAKRRRCSQTQVRRWLKAGKFPARWLCAGRGRRIRFKDTEELQKFLATGKFPTLPRLGRPLEKPGGIFTEGRYFAGFEFFIPNEELENLTPAEQEQVKADLRRDAAYVEAAKTPMEQLERFGGNGKKFKLPPQPLEATMQEGFERGKREESHMPPDIDAEENKNTRDAFRELAAHVHKHQKKRWIKKPPLSDGAEGDHLA
jgi:hypothetical protein